MMAKEFIDRWNAERKEKEDTDWIQDELNARRHEYLLTEFARLKKELGEYEEHENQIRSVFEGNNHDCSFASNNSKCRQKIKDMLTEIVDDVMLVFDFGAKKHPDSGNTPNFLEDDGNKCSKHDRGSSILRHAARTFMSPNVVDEESGLPELLHLMASASIMYIRVKRDIVHPQDDKYAE